MAYVRQATIATGPRTNSHKIQSYMKERWPAYTPGAQSIATFIVKMGLVEPTGRRIMVGSANCHTVNEYLVLEASA
jgi:acetylornithine deacetylase/succinyl-diaminopimelate desuccinylase-like protein